MTQPVLQLEEVSKRFGKVVVADTLTFDVGRDEVLGVVGPNGAGKTSVFGLISGDLLPDSGRILFGDKDVNRLSPARRCRLGIGRTYQVPRPFERMTVFENVLVAAQSGAGLKSRTAHKLAYSVLEETGLVASGNRRTATLGLLQRKRLELAKALATRPRLLLLDEVAAGLTDPEVDELIGIVAAARQRSAEEGLAIIWVEHVVRALVRTVSRMICLDAGRIVADGSPEAVMSDEKVREVYLGAEIVTTTETPSAARQDDQAAAPSGSSAGR